MKKFDMFGITYNFKMENEEKYKSLSGGILSIIFYSLTIALFFSFGVDLYQRKSPKVSFNSKIENHQNTILSNLNFTLAFRVEDSFGIQIKNQSIINFEVGFFHYDMDDNGKWALTAIQANQSITYSMCSEIEGYKAKEKFYNISLANWYCVNFTNFTFGGYWDGKFINGILINTLQCSSRVTNQFSKYNTSQCLDDKQMEKVYDSNYTGTNIFYSFLYMESLPVMDNFEFPLRNYLVNKYEMLNLRISKRAVQLFKRIVVDSDFGWLFADRKTENDISNDMITSDFMLKDEFNQNILFTHLIYLGRKVDTYYRIYTKLQEVLASVGGFSKIFLMLLNFLHFFISRISKNFLLLERIEFHEDIARRFDNYNIKNNIFKNNAITNNFFYNNNSNHLNISNNYNNNNNKINNNFNNNDKDKDSLNNNNNNNHCSYMKRNIFNENCNNRNNNQSWNLKSEKNYNKSPQNNSQNDCINNYTNNSITNINNKNLGFPLMNIKYHNNTNCNSKSNSTNNIININNNIFQELKNINKKNSMAEINVQLHSLEKNSIEKQEQEQHQNYQNRQKINGSKNDNYGKISDNKQNNILNNNSHSNVGINFRKKSNKRLDPDTEKKNNNECNVNNYKGSLMHVENKISSTDNFLQTFEKKFSEKDLNDNELVKHKSLQNSKNFSGLIPENEILNPKASTGKSTNADNDKNNKNYANKYYNSLKSKFNNAFQNSLYQANISESPKNLELNQMKYNNFSLSNKKFNLPKIYPGNQCNNMENSGFPLNHKDFSDKDDENYLAENIVNFNNNNIITNRLNNDINKNNTHKTTNMNHTKKLTQKYINLNKNFYGKDKILTLEHSSSNYGIFKCNNFKHKIVKLSLYEYVIFKLCCRNKARETHMTINNQININNNSLNNTLGKSEAIRANIKKTQTITNALLSKLSHNIKTNTINNTSNNQNNNHNYVVNNILSQNEDELNNRNFNHGIVPEAEILTKIKSSRENIFHNYKLLKLNIDNYFDVFTYISLIKDVRNLKEILFQENDYLLDYLKPRFNKTFEEKSCLTKKNIDELMLLNDADKEKNFIIKNLCIMLNNQFPI